MTILSEKGQRSFSFKGKDVRMRAIICDDDGRFAKRLEQSVTQYYRNMGMTLDTIVVTNPKILFQRSDLASFDIAFLDADMKPMDGIEVGRVLKKQKAEIIIVFVSAYLEFAPKGYTVDAFRYVLKQDIQNTLPLPNNEIPLSTKLDTGHGIGLKNVVAILQKYHAEHTLSAKQGWFQFTGLIYL